MDFVTIGEVRFQCKADENVTDAQLTLYADAAERTVQQLANRAIYKDGDTRDAALSALPSTMAAAYTTYDAAIAAAKAQSDSRNIAYQTQLAEGALQAAQVSAEGIANSIVLTPDIKEAVLLLTTHYYQNPSAVLTGQGATAAEVPMAAEAIMSRYRWLGPL